MIQVPLKTYVDATIQLFEGKSKPIHAILTQVNDFSATFVTETYLDADMPHQMTFCVQRESITHAMFLTGVRMHGLYKMYQAAFLNAEATQLLTQTPAHAEEMNNWFKTLYKVQILNDKQSKSISKPIAIQQEVKLRAMLCTQ